MANSQLQRGQKQQVDVTFKLAGASVALDFAEPNSAELVIRRSLTGAIIDTLTTADNRIVLYSNAPDAGPNINLHWSTAQSTKLPNESITVIGDLKIANNATFANGEVLYHIRLTFDILPEVIA